MTAPLTALALILGVGSFTGKYAIYRSGAGRAVAARAALVVLTVCVLMLPLEFDACSAWRLRPADASLGALAIVGGEVFGTATHRRVGALACTTALAIAFANAHHTYTDECSAMMFSLCVVGMTCAPLVFFYS
jgi:hypothetical protein